MKRKGIKLNLEADFVSTNVKAHISCLSSSKTDKARQALHAIIQASTTSPTVASSEPSTTTTGTEEAAPGPKQQEDIPCDYCWNGVGDGCQQQNYVGAWRNVKLELKDKTAFIGDNECHATLSVEDDSIECILFF